MTTFMLVNLYVIVPTWVCSGFTMIAIKNITITVIIIIIIFVAATTIPKLFGECPDLE